MTLIRNGTVIVCLIHAAVCVPNAAKSQSIVTPVGDVAAAEAVLRDRFAIGRSLVNPRTLAAQSLDELVDLTAGTPSLSSFRNYGGNFERYWKAVESQRAGKTFEAMVTQTLNEQLEQVGSGERWVVTAVEGVPAHPADLLRLAEDRTIVERGQSKLGWKKAMASLDDAKYGGMRIVTTPDSIQIIEQKLRKAEESAARRGIALVGNWQTVRDALDTGRLLREPIPGLLPTRQEVSGVAMRTAETRWRGLAAIADSELGTSASKAKVGRGVGLRLGGKVAVRAFFVIDIAATSAQTYWDVQRFNSGEIDTGDLAIKLYIRSANVSLAYTAAFDPEPTTKVVAAVCLMVVIAADAVHDAIIDARARAARRLLGSIDREERVQAVRRQMLNEVRQLAEQ